MAHTGMAKRIGESCGDSPGDSVFLTGNKN